MKTRKEILDQILKNGTDLECMGILSRSYEPDCIWVHNSFNAKIIHSPEGGFTASEYLYVYEIYEKETCLFPMKEEDGLLVTDDGTVIYLYGIED